MDSSGWIEFLQNTERAVYFEPALEDLAGCLVSCISLFEVHRLVAAKQSEAAADSAVHIMGKCRVVPLDSSLARLASRIARSHKLALADAIIYATAHQHGAELWTQDAHFKALPNVRYFPKP